AGRMKAFFLHPHSDTTFFYFCLTAKFFYIFKCMEENVKFTTKVFHILNARGRKCPNSQEKFPRFKRTWKKCPNSQQKFSTFYTYVEENVQIHSKNVHVLNARGS
uniref:Uncharacterized protein n=1 Tax=Clytia hemisphaerica TaxID=252671 RepID=A0A7M5WUD6_9CNID